MAGITTARGLAVLSPWACSAQVWYLLYMFNPAAITLVAEKMSIFSRKAVLLCSPSLPVHGGFRPTLPGNWSTPESSVWY
jgi:hypothetical protein